MQSHFQTCGRCQKSIAAGTVAQAGLWTVGSRISQQLQTERHSMADSAAHGAAADAASSGAAAAAREPPQDHLPALRAARAVLKKDLKRATQDIKNEAGGACAFPEHTQSQGNVFFKSTCDKKSAPPVRKRRRLMKKAAGLSAADLAWLLAKRAAAE
eukprot:s2861_g4.t1